MARKRLVIHAGTYKTGSSAIQLYLARAGHYGKLGGAVYPTTGRALGVQHGNLTAQLRRGRAFVPARGGWDELLAEINAGDAETTVVSSEHFASLTPDQLAKARAAASAWKAKPPIAEANTVNVPAGGWDGGSSIAVSADDQQALVKKIQALLTEQGYDVGTPDGVAGPKTRDAVKAYQRSIGAAETGQIDQKLVALLSDH